MIMYTYPPAFFVSGTFSVGKSKRLDFGHFCQFLDLVFFQKKSFFIFWVILKAICLLNKDMTSKNLSGPGKWPKMAAKVPKWHQIKKYL